MKHEITTGKLILNYGKENEAALGEIKTMIEPIKLYKCFCTTCGITFTNKYLTNVCCSCFEKYINSSNK